jgi:hypothetical protein
MRLIAAVAVVLVLMAWWLGVVHVAQAQASGWQRDFQDMLAGTVRAIQRGDGTAFWALVAAAAGYGLAHAAGPGHGKVLIGGVSLATRVGAARLRCCLWWPVLRNPWWPSCWFMAGCRCWGFPPGMRLAWQMSGW